MMFDSHKVIACAALKGLVDVDLETGLSRKRTLRGRGVTMRVVAGVVL